MSHLLVIFAEAKHLLLTIVSLGNHIKVTHFYWVAGQFCLKISTILTWVVAAALILRQSFIVLEFIGITLLELIMVKNYEATINVKLICYIKIVIINQQCMQSLICKYGIPHLLNVRYGIISMWILIKSRKQLSNFLVNFHLEIFLIELYKIFSQITFSMKQ